MTPRERNIAIGILALIVLGGGAFAGYALVISPLEDTNAAIQQLKDEIDGTPDKEGLDFRVTTMKKAASQIAQVKRESLPLNEDIAKTQYKILIERLLKQAKINEYAMPNATKLENRAPATPELAPKKPAYTRLSFHVDITKTTIWHLADFLYGFYRQDLLHQITELKITRNNKPTEARNGLDVHITIEAIILDGADAKTSLFPLVTGNRLTPTGEAFAAIGGGRFAEAVTASPEVARKVTVVTDPPILATHARDYSLLALKDIFYGILPPNKTYTGITIAKIDDIKINHGDKIPNVKIHLSGDEVEGSKLIAKASGYLIPEGPLKIDPDTNTISFPPTLENAPNWAGATISVVATSESGREQKTTFKVSFNPTTKDDISAAIKLVMISGSTEGTMTAIIQDAANPFRYKIAASKKEIKVTKFTLAVLKPRWRPEAGRDDWREVKDYKGATGILAFSDETSRTKRTFQVLAIEENALIVADIDVKQDAKIEPKGRGGNRPGGGPPLAPPPNSSPKGGPANALAGVVGDLALAAPPANPGAMNPPPVMYRWSNGMSLKDLDDSSKKAKLSPDEAKKVLRQIAQNGFMESPVFLAK